MKQVSKIKHFRNTLRLIKLWAMRRGIYSHQFGYLGGFSYAIMVAKICQDYPQLEVSDLLYKFFEVYSDWKWLDSVNIKIQKKKDKLNMNSLQVLNAFSYDPMIILTPLNNPKNTAYRVTQFTFETIIKEIKRARDIIKNLSPVTFKKYAPIGEKLPEEILIEANEE